MKRILLAQAALLSTLFISSAAYPDTVISVSTPGPLLTSNTGNIEITDTGQVITTTVNAIELNAADTSVTIDANNATYGTNAVSAANNVGINITASGTVTVGGGGSGVTSGGYTGIYVTALANIINNGGTIEGNGNGGVYLDVGSDNSQINNNSGGVILDNSGSFGMTVVGTGINLTNDGVNSGVTGTGGGGIILTSSASGATIQNSSGAQITDGNNSFGMSVSGANLNLTNTGVDENSGTISTISGTGKGGIVLTSTASGATIINEDGALITDTNGSFGIGASGTNLAITNTGVDAQSGDISTISGSGAGGIVLANTASGATITNEDGALITDTSGSFGISASGAGLTLTNDGTGSTISGSGAGGIVLASTASGAAIMNTSSALITDTGGGVGITSSSSVTITNTSSTISGTPTAIDLSSATEGTVVQNSGTIQGDVYLAPSPTATNVLTMNGGTVNGSIYTNASSPLLTTLALNGGTITGNINILGNAIIADNIEAEEINISGANSTIHLTGSSISTVNPFSIFFVTGVTASTNLIFDNNVTISGGIDNTVKSPVVNIQFLGSASFPFIQNTVNSIHFAGTGSTITGNIVVTGTNLYMDASNINIVLEDGGEIFCQNLINTTGGATGTITMEGGGTLSTAGILGESSPLQQIVVNALGLAGKSVLIQSSELVANQINLQDGGNPTTLTIHTAGILTTNIIPQTPNIDTLILNGGATIVASSSLLGTAAVPLGTLEFSSTGGLNVGATVYSKLITLNQNTTLGNFCALHAQNLQFQANKTLTVNGRTADASTIINSPITTTVAGQGTLTLKSAFSGNNTIGSSTDQLGAINITGSSGQNFNFNNYNVFSNTLSINNGATLSVTGQQRIDSAVAFTNASVLSLGAGGELNITNTTSAGTLNLGTGTTLAVTMNGFNAGSITTAGLATTTPSTLLQVNNPPVVSTGTLVIPLITSQGGGANLHPLIVNQQGFTTEVDGNTLNLIFTGGSPLSAFGTVGNNQGVAQALQTIMNSGVRTYGTLQAIINEIPTLSASEISYDLTTLSPVVDGAMVQSVMNNLPKLYEITQRRYDENYFGMRGPIGLARAQNLESYVAGDNERPVGSWAKIFGQHATQQTRNFIAGYTDDTAGFAFGFDTTLTSQALIGVSLSYTHAQIHNKVSAGSYTTIDSYQALLYGEYLFENPLYFNGYMTAAYNNYIGHRNVNFGSILLTALSEFDGLQYGGKGELGYIFNLKNYDVIPLVSLYYSYLNLTGYTEMGLDTANQVVNPSDYNFLEGGLGIKIAKDFQIEFLMLQPEIHAMFLYDFVQDNVQLTSQFTSAGPSFVTYGIEMPNKNYNLGMSLSVFNHHNLAFTASYDFDFKAQYTAHAGFMRLRWEWY